MPSTCEARTKRAVQRPPTRARITTWPNFRDHRKSVAGPLLALLCRLQRKHGWTYVAEAGLRKMLCEDTGHMPGMDTVRRALDRLEELGYLHQVWLLKGGVMPDGGETYAGIRLIRVAMSRDERHSFLARARARARHREGRETTTGRVNHRALFDLMTVQKSAAPSAAAPPVDVDARRRENVAAVSALMASWAAQGLDPNTGQPLKPS